MALALPVDVDAELSGRRLLHTASRDVLAAGEGAEDAEAVDAHAAGKDMKGGRGVLDQLLHEALLVEVHQRISPCIRVIEKSVSSAAHLPSPNKSSIRARELLKLVKAAALRLMSLANFSYAPFFASSVSGLKPMKTVWIGVSRDVNSLDLAVGVIKTGWVANCSATWH